MEIDKITESKTIKLVILLEISPYIFDIDPYNSTSLCYKSWLSINHLLQVYFLLIIFFHSL